MSKKTTIKRNNKAWLQTHLTKLVPHIPFAILFLLGTMLRRLSFIAYKPALLYYGDSFYYLQNAKKLGFDSFHPPGYAVFLHLLSWTHNLLWVNFTQHLLGLISAIIIYLLFLKLRLKPWLGALAVAPILLDAYIINAENMVMAEALTSFLLICICVLLLWSAHKKVWQLLLAGILLAATTIVRSVAGVFILPATLYIVFSDGFILKGIKPKLYKAVILGAAFIIPIFSYCWFHKMSSGKFTIDTKSNLFLYGRLAPITDCEKLPSAQKTLCAVDIPVTERYGPSWFIWSPRSPMRKSLKPRTYNVPDRPLGEFNRAMLKNQLPTYATSIITETGSYFLPSRLSGIKDDPLIDTLFPTRANWTGNTHLSNGSFDVQSSKNFADRLPNPQIAQWLHSYQRFLYLPGPLLAVAVIAWAIAFAKRRSRLEIAGAFLISSALIFLFVTSAAAAFNYRYLVPIEEILWMGGIMGFASLLQQHSKNPKTKST